MSGSIEFEFMDFWHCSAGHGSGRYLDAVVIRSPAGLPIVPGRTVKGLLRDVVRQCEALGHIEAGTCEKLFGTALGEDRFATEPGSFFVGDATLPTGWESFARSPEGNGYIDAFYDQLSSTSLDEDRTARDRTLRRVEVAVPVTLSARWTCEDPDLARATLARALPLLRRLGSGRHRGFGRVQVKLTDGGDR
jgi:CRISPR/Cas system CSM-associated protein Csm3 (group 7 of RAMP superfamily)